MRALAVALALVTTTCVPGPLPLSVPAPPTTTKAVHDRQNEFRESRETQFLGRSKNGQTGFKEHLVDWRGPGTHPRKVVVPFPLLVHDAHYRWRVSNIFGGPYRSRWGGWCWNFRYETPREGTTAPRVNYAFACQHHNGNWYAFKDRWESPAR